MAAVALVPFPALALVTLVIAAAAEEELDAGIATGMHPHERHAQRRLRHMPPSDGSLQQRAQHLACGL